MVYNTFPTPNSELGCLEVLAQKILKIRNKYKNSTLAQLYDPGLMPADLKKAHDKLDQKVDKIYRDEPFESDSDRIQFLLQKYDEILKARDVKNE